MAEKRKREINNMERILKGLTEEEKKWNIVVT